MSRNVDKWSERRKWEIAWSEAGLEEEIRPSGCPLHPRARLIFLAGYQYIFPDGSKETIAAGWVCSTCYVSGRVPVEVKFNAKGEPDLETAVWARIVKLSVDDYVSAVLGRPRDERARKTPGDIP